MAANGGGPPLSPPLIKKEEGGSDDLDQNDHHDRNIINNNMKGISIADRRAAKCGFNADNINTARFFGPGCNNASLSSPYVTIPPGISPSALFDSPMLVPNAQAQQSPTTGTFHQFPLSSNPDQSLKLKLKLASEEGDSSFKPEPDNFTFENLPFEDYFDQYPRDFEQTSKKDCFEDKNEEGLMSLHQPSKNTTSSNQMPRESRNSTNINPNYQEMKNQHHQKGAYVPKEVAKHSEDGFYWRKYGQKHVKGSEFPRSYYKCTNANCLVKKKVERSHAGEITQIVYKGSHNHPIPQPFNNKRFNDMANDHGGGTSFKAEGANKDVATAVLGSDHNWVPGHGCLASQFPNNNPLPITNFDQTHVEATTNHDFSANTATVGSQDGEDQNQASPESITCKDEYDENNTECEPKKRKRENLPSNETTIPRSGRESKVVVQIESDVDILDDGYRWRKYGQKVVKGNPNPRSYYKCTTPGCPVRKHVERAANDIKSVLTTYEGKHNHDVPTSKTGNLAVSEASSMLQQVIANNNNNSNNSIGSPKPPDHVSNKAGKQAQDSSNLPLYMGGKPILSYNDFMRSNFTGHDLAFGPLSSLYPYSFPPFPTVAYSSHFMNANNSNNNNNNNHLKMYSSSSSKFSYPMLAPDYLSQMSLHVPGGPAVASHVPNVGANLTFGNYSGLQNTSQGPREQIMKPKEEQTEDEGELFDPCRIMEM